MTDMKLVYICSPYAGDIEYNTKRAIAYCRYAADSGVIPLAPHLLLPRFLCESNPAERELGIKMGLRLLALCSELWVNVKRFVMKSRILKPVETQALRQENFA
jgi:hypothetical protein